MLDKIRILYKIAFGIFPKLSIISLIGIIVSVLMEIPLPLFTKYFIDTIIPSKDFSALTLMGLGLIIILIFSQIMDFIRTYYSSLLSQKISNKLGVNAFNKLIHANYQTIQANQSGYWFSRILNDAFDLGDAFENMVRMLTNILLFIVGIGFTFYFSIELGIVISLLVPLYIIILKVFNPVLRRKNEISREANAKLSGLLDETVSRIVEVKSLFIEELKKEQIDRTWKSTIKHFMDNIKTTTLSSILGNSIASIGAILVLWYGGYLVIHGKISLGELIALNSFLGYVITPLEGLMGINQQMQSIFVAYERIHEIEGMGNIENSFSKTIIIKNQSINHLNIRNLNFSYDENKIFNSYNLSVDLGEFTCINAPSGFGKSTLLKLISGLLYPDSGDVEITIKNTNNSSNNDIILIPQSALIFADTFWNNIKMERDIDDETIISVIKNIQLEEVASKMPEGMDTQLGAFSGKISGGEKQRIAIARALVANPAILLIDEMTSEIDEETESRIFQSLREIRKNKVTIFVTHRSSSFRYADQLITLNNN